MKSIVHKEYTKREFVEAQYCKTCDKIYCCDSLSCPCALAWEKHHCKKNKKASENLKASVKEFWKQRRKEETARNRKITKAKEKNSQAKAGSDKAGTKRARSARR